MHEIHTVIYIIIRLYLIIRKGEGVVNSMADFYAAMIVQEARTYEQVPARLKPAVKAALVALAVWEVYGDGSEA